MEKGDVQKLIDSKSGRLSYEEPKGKSVAWKHFSHVKVDGTAVPFVKCEKCSSLLQWKSRDGTSGLHSHVEFCKSKSSQPKITTVPGFSSTVQSPKLPSSVKSDLTDVIVRWCARDIRFVKVITVSSYSLITVFIIIIIELVCLLVLTITTATDAIHMASRTYLFTIIIDSVQL